MPLSKFGRRHKKTFGKKKEKWDGKSRPSNDLYRDNFNKIFGKKKPEVTSNIDTLTKSMQLNVKDKNVKKKKKTYIT